MKTGGVNRSNIFGITKDNHLNAGRLVLQSLSVGLSQILDLRSAGLVPIGQTRVCVSLATICFDSLYVEQLWRKEKECIPSSST